MVLVENEAQCWVFFSSKPGMRQFQLWKSSKYKIKPVLWTKLCWKLDATSNPNANPKARAVNKAQQQLRPESYFLEFFKWINIWLGKWLQRQFFKFHWIYWIKGAGFFTGSWRPQFFQRILSTLDKINEFEKHVC